MRALGSRHSLSDLADSEELVTLDRLPRRVVVDRGTMTVSVNGAIRYGELAEELAREGLALHNLASLPHIAVAGAVATGTHGSGDRNGNLATAVAGLELVTSNGDIRQARRGDPDFDGMVVSLGAVGVITRVTLDVEPEYRVRPHVFEGMRWATRCGTCDRGRPRGHGAFPAVGPGERDSNHRRRHSLDEPAVWGGHRRRPFHVGTASARSRGGAHALEAALAPFNPRPHWGKLFMLRADAMRRAYARLPDFVAPWNVWTRVERSATGGWKPTCSATARS